MRKILFVLAAALPGLVVLPCLVVAQAPNTLSPAEKQEGWTLLFNGTSTAGWHTYGQPSAINWVVQDGAFTPNPSAAGHGDLLTDGVYGDFDLKLEWKISPKGNSGILFYVNEDTAKYKETYFTGPEMQVLDNNGNPDAKYHAHRAGDLYDLISCARETVKPAGQWNQVEIYSKGGQLKLFLNGVNVVSTTLWNERWFDMVAHSKFKRWPDFGTFHSGRIALQYHDFPVWFRNIKIKKL